jgi:hypothetical protein
MRLAAVGFVAALLAAPLAAQAAQQPARFAATLQGTIVDEVTYERTVVADECTSIRTGRGGRKLAIRSLRPTTIEVTGGASPIVYRPSRLVALRVAATRLAGAYSELRSCRFLPPEKLNGKCQQETGSVRRVPATFRSGRNAILFNRPATAQNDVTACGLDRTLPGSWLELVRGRIDQDALLNGRSRRVFARAAGTRESTAAVAPTVKVTRQTTVRWTLTFQRLS